MTENKPTIDDFVRTRDSDPIWAARGKAIGAYAGLEQILAEMFGYLGEMPDDVARLVFFKITSFPVIKALLDKLMRRRYGDAYGLFWNSFLKDLSTLANSRNEIVHWFPRTFGTEGEGGISWEVKLVPQATILEGNREPAWSATDLADFRVKCIIFSGECSSFRRFLISVSAGFSDEPSSERFLQPLIYPPPRSHPLFQIYEERQSRHRSSEE